MKKGKISSREIVMVLALVLLLLGLWYYNGFYLPLQNELSTLNAQGIALDDQILAAQTKLQSMNQMQEELDAILAQPKEEITEIAPYDNKDAVFNELNGILYGIGYNLDFSDTEINSDGTVRRVISMSFRCSNYNKAKEIVSSLARCQWRCLVGNLSVSCGDNIMTDEVQVSVTITFFESTKLNSTENATA